MPRPCCIHAEDLGENFSQVAGRSRFLCLPSGGPVCDEGGVTSLRNILVCLMTLMSGLSLLGQAPTPAQLFLLTQQARTAFTVQGAGARATGTGGAFIAIADDATAVSFNPAGLGQLLRPEVSLVVNGASRDLNFTGFTGQGPNAPTTFEDTANTDRSISPSFASFAVPWKHEGRNFVFLMSYQRFFDFTYDSSVDYLATTNGGATVQAISQRIHQTGGVDLYSAAIGADLTPRLLLGVSLNSWQGRSSFSSFSQRTTSGVNVQFDSNLAQASVFHGFNATLGLIWRSQWLNLGLTYRTPYTATYSFSNRYDYIDNKTGLLTQSAGPGTSCALKWPETLGIGLGLHLGPRGLLTLDSSRTPWSQARYSGSALDGLNWFDFQANTATKDTTDFHLGGEWIAWLGDKLVVPLRAGVFREPQPIVDTTTGAQRVLLGWTLGSGAKFKDMTVDLALKISHDQRGISRYNTDSPIGGIASSALGTEHLEERRVVLSVIYQLDAERVRRALSWLFIGS